MHLNVCQAFKVEFIWLNNYEMNLRGELIAHYEFRTTEKSDTILLTRRIYYWGSSEAQPLSFLDLLPWYLCGYFILVKTRHARRSVTQCAITRLFSLVSPSHITSPVSPSHLTSHITSHSSGIFLTTVRENIVRVLNKIWRRDILWMLRSAWSHRLQFHCWIWNADPWAGFSIRRRS